MIYIDVLLLTESNFPVALLIISHSTSDLILAIIPASLIHTIPLLRISAYTELDG